MATRRATVAAVTVVLTTGLLVGSASPALADDAVRTPSGADYAYDLSSSSRGRAWDGTASIAFANSGTEPLDVVWLRLWANASVGCGDPTVVVSGVDGGVAGDASVGCTALPVTLDAPLAPGASTTIAFDVAIDLPAANDRIGWHARTARLGNALPILAVHDDEEGWHLDPPFAFGESFYSLVADWTVTLTVPRWMETPTSGTLLGVTGATNGREERTFSAPDVRDFAWEAGEFDVARARDRRGVAVRVWYPENLLERDQGKRLARRSAHIMDTFSSAFGAYPYPEIDVVITSFDNFGGMEYPTLVMSIPNPVTISHELAHQWWYGIVGNDQHEDPWIDEGFAQWAQFLPFGRIPGSTGWPPLPFVGCSMLEWTNDEVRLSSGVPYFSAHPGDYYLVYWQGACALAHLAQHLGGLEPFLEVLRAYAADHWLGVATNADVMAAIEAAAAEAGNPFDPQRFFERWRISRP